MFNSLCRLILLCTSTPRGNPSMVDLCEVVYGHALPKNAVLLVGCLQLANDLFKILNCIQNMLKMFLHVS